MTEELPKAYDFNETEKRVYTFWEENGFFQPGNDPQKPGFDPGIEPFVISIPPPNVTGELHLGHALFVAMEDLMIRYHRMKGIPTLWVPGSDHAGIATQLQIEKLLRSEGLTREQIGRDEFVRRTWEWKTKYGGIITQQIRRLGASCDWSRERFTLDEGLSVAVREAFVRLYEKGLVYRGPRLINWSPGLRTAVSDLEVEYSEEPGTLYYFKYMLSDSRDEYIPVATTRPETILGDTAVAVHPEDERYRVFIGRSVIVPILGREIPVIADTYVDQEFGTGALKITPGHDPNDYIIGQRHNLEIISVLDETARVNQNGGPYAGQDRFDARKNLWEDMRSQDLVIKEEPYTLNVPRSQRGGEIIEPMISTQWFVKMDSLAEAAIQVVREGQIQIIPERFTKVYYNWLENIQDWCISRQLWWGHRIPVWYCADCSGMTVSRLEPTSCAHCGSERIEQDPDVLDTWFSSGLWPFSTLGWPEQTPDLDYFYPTSVLETGYDILFFWVVRMIVSGLEYTQQVPFHTVYLHGLIRDGNGKKMSKSSGNSIDPLEVMDQFGTDALRFTLLVGSTPGNDINVSLQKVEANRNFANKLWNAGRLIMGLLGSAPASPEHQPEWTLADGYIWARTGELVREVESLFNSYQYGEAGRQIYEFFWSEFADWYLEIAKLQIAKGGDLAYYTADLMLRVFDIVLRMLHPFTPFVTEEIWGHLKRTAIAHSDSMTPEVGGWAEALIVAQWPEPWSQEGWEKSTIASFRQVQEIIRAIRNVRAEKNVKPSTRIPAILSTSMQMAHFLLHEIEMIAALSGVDQDAVTLVATTKGTHPRPEGHIGMVAGEVEIYLPLAEMIDKNEEKARLGSLLAETQSQIERLQNLLNGPFADKAPANVVEKEREKLSAYQSTAEKLNAQLDALE